MSRLIEADLLRSADDLFEPFRSALDGGEMLVAGRRAVELLAYLDRQVDARWTRDFLRRVGSLLHEAEHGLVEQLRLIGIQKIPLSWRDWHAIHEQPNARPFVDHAGMRQNIGLDILQSAAPYAPTIVADAIEDALTKSAVAHLEWISSSEGTPSRFVLALARLLFRERQMLLLAEAPVRWLALVEALTRQDAERALPPSPRIDVEDLPEATRGLCWECTYALARALAIDSQEGELTPLDQALLEGETGSRFGAALAVLLIVNSPPSYLPGSSDEERVMWIYQRLALTASAPTDGPSRTTPIALSVLTKPFTDRLEPKRRLAYRQAGKELLERVNVRCAELAVSPGKLAGFRGEKRNRVALQLVLRSF